MPAYLEEPDIALPDVGSQPLKNDVSFFFFFFIIKFNYIDYHYFII